jgi:hypothetical protein
MPLENIVDTDMELSINAYDLSVIPQRTNAFIHCTKVHRIQTVKLNTA